MRKVRHFFEVVLVIGVLSASPAAASPSPFPATLTMQRGLTESAAGHALTWGTELTVAQARWVTLKSSVRSPSQWGVWKPRGGPGQFPVRSGDYGHHWTAAGPQLATDWAGGSLFYVTRVIWESPSAVVMVSNSIIDVTTDGGHQWYQYLNSADNWSITGHLVLGAGIAIRVGPASYSTLPKASYALYVYVAAHHHWHRIAQSLT